MQWCPIGPSGETFCFGGAECCWQGFAPLFRWAKSPFAARSLREGDAPGVLHPVHPGRRGPGLEATSSLANAEAAFVVVL